MTINREDEWKIEGLEVTAPLDSNRYLELEPLVNEIASQEWKRSALYELDDVVQAIWLHMMEHWKDYEEASVPLTRHMVRRAAKAFCEKQRVDYMYAMGAYLYTPALVRRYLETVVWCAPENCPDVDARVDLTEALGKLSTVQHAAIYKKYALKEPLTTPGERTAESRGVSAITNRLNTGLRLRAEDDGDF